jgi:hypothetical protein
MKYIVALSLLFVLQINFYFSQSDFYSGFNAGYEKANPISIPPVPPLPPIGKDTYGDGYGLGYAKGLADYNASNNPYNIPNGSSYQPNTQQQNNFIPEYKPVAPDYQKMGEMLREKQKARNKNSRTYYRPKTVTKTYHRPTAAPNWNSYSIINRSFCSVSFKSNNNTIVFSTNDNNTYQVWQNNQLLGYVTRSDKLVFENIKQGTYQFQVYKFNRRRRKRLRFSKTWSLSTSKNIYFIDMTNKRMDFKY